MPNIYQKLLLVQTELKAPKNQYNKFGQYNYRNCEDILEALKPLLKKVNATVFITDEIQYVLDRVYVRATVHFVDCESGEKLETHASARESETKKGMDDSQVTGATSSYARKYALNALFAIDDTKDFDSMDNTKNDQKAEKAEKAEPKKEPKKEQELTKNKAREMLLGYCKANEIQAVEISKKYGLNHETTTERFVEVLEILKGGNNNG